MEGMEVVREKGQEDQATTGLQGVRLAKLQRALDRAIDKSLEKCTPETFVECFSPLLHEAGEEEDAKKKKGKKAKRAKKQPEKDEEAERVLLEARERLLPTISRTIKIKIASQEEFNSVCGRWDVSEKLLLLDQYAEQQEQRDIKQRSLQPLKVSPLKLGLTIEGDIKRQERDLLLQVMQELEEENRQLREELIGKRQLHDHFLQNFDTSTSQLGKAAMLCRDWAKSDARRWMEQELAAPRATTDK